MTSRSPSTPLVVLAGCAGLAVAHLGATFLLLRIGSRRASQMKGVAEAGMLPLPGGEVLQTITDPLHAGVAALVYTGTLGLLTVMVAYTLATVTRRWGWRGRSLPVAVATVSWGVIALAPTSNSDWWVWLTLVFVTTYGLRLIAGGDGPTKPVVRLTIFVVCAAGIAAPPALLADKHVLTDIRDGLIAVPGGGVLVNSYYRHALIAAEPIKKSTHRLVSTYVLTDSPNANKLPRWLVCQREPWVLLRTTSENDADLAFKRTDGGGVALRAGGTRMGFLTRQNAESFFLRYARRSDPAALRLAVTLGVFLGPISFLATSLMLATRGLRKGYPYSTFVAAAVIGTLLAYSVAELNSSHGRAAIEGSVPERLRAVRAEATSVETIASAARHDRALPVRAHALREWIRRRGPTPEARSRVARAPSWYEQWHGYRALLKTSWHPADGTCGSA